MLDLISPYYSKLWTLGIILILAIFSPGPDFTIVVRNSLLYSKRKALFTVLGITFGELTHIIYNILGISIIINKSPWILRIIGIIGGTYISYLGFASFYAGYKFLKSKKKIKNDIKTKINTKISNFNAFKMGFLTNILNPKAVLFFISVFGSLINNNTPKIIIIIFIFESTIIAFICFSLVALLFSIDIIRNLFFDYSHWIEIITGILFILIGIKLVLG